MKVTKQLQRSTILAQLETLCHIFQGSRDTLVEIEPENLIAQRLPNACLVKMDSKHESYQSENQVLEPYLEEMLNSCK